ncbi:MAG: sigma-70 family RNA polymerase sigma factor [Bacteroidota bacterium]
MFTEPRPKESINEAELIVRLRNKDRKAYAILYDRYSGALYGVILKIVKYEEIAQDVLQDTFVKIWKKIDAYSATKGTLFTWILNIARNTAIDRLRSQEYKRIAKSKPIESIASESRVNVSQKTDHIGIRKIVESLKPEYQEVIQMVYFKGYTHVEAAEALALPLGTVKTRIKIALRELRKLT